jgi:hypothetical protein
MRLKASRGSEQYQAMKLVDGVLVDAARSWRTEAVKNGGLAVIQVRQAEHSATVIWLNLWLAHDDGLPVRRLGITADCPQIATGATSRI